MSKRTKTNDTPEYSVDDRVIIFGGVVDTDGLIESTIETATIVQVGESDLLVTLGTTSSYQIVPKNICIPLKSDSKLLESATPLKPQLGDMVYFRGRESWKYIDETTVVGVVYEIAFAGGRPKKAKVHVGSEMKDLDYDSLLVLQRKS